MKASAAANSCWAIDPEGRVHAGLDGSDEVIQFVLVSGSEVPGSA
jgi:hypothetical protein